MKRRYKSPVNKFISLIVNMQCINARRQYYSRGVYLKNRNVGMTGPASAEKTRLYGNPVLGKLLKFEIFNFLEMH